MIPNRKRTLTTIGVLAFFVGTLALVWAAKVLREPNGIQKLAAWEMGGEYLGGEGVSPQDKRNNCGPAALKMVLDHHKMSAPLREIEERVELSERGSSMLALKRVAELHRLHVEGWRLSLEDLCRKPFPVIIFVENRHFVVVDSLDNTGFFYVRDPAIGRVKIPRKRLANIWKGETLVFGKELQPSR